MDRWAKIHNEHTLDDAHVIPIEDLREHEDSRECWCQPCFDRSDIGRVIVIHNSMDGRELIEKHGLQ